MALRRGGGALGLLLLSAACLIPPSAQLPASLVNGTFLEIKDRMFSHLPSLQLLLLNSNSFTVIRDDAFAGLFHLEYLFIEGNKIETISRNAFRGLRDLTHLSLANNHIKALPRDVFSDLDSLIELDLRGNRFECDCKAKWLYLWLKMTNSTVSDVLCIGPPEYQEKKLNDVTSFDYECTTTGQSIVGCKAILIDDQVFVVVAQLFGGSHIYKYDESWTKFVKFQDIEVSRISKPNDIELFEIDDETFFIIADSSKAGLSTVYKWNSKGFYSYQSLHEWFRDTDAEFVDIDGKSHLILSSRSQVPIILQWNKSSKKFVPHGDIPNMEDVLAVKSFRMQNTLYLSLTRFIGDSRVMRWNSKQFVEVQALPSRGAMTLQPFSFKDNHYLALGSDYTFSQIYQWDKEKQQFTKFKEIYVQAPRSFTAVSTDRRDFFFASSFKGKTKIFEHIIVDLSL
ncbi:Leucine-rich repeat LGI family member 2 [Apodemus speciosus]|uniref:Leucine-rich repeat LGI family member 2 n=1 Tax=Apodemus speciosus TaxID=105296 RepID=A0ABQ0ERH6_APOSI